MQTPSAFQSQADSIVQACNVVFSPHGELCGWLKTTHESMKEVKKVKSAAWHRQISTRLSPWHLSSTAPVERDQAVWAGLGFDNLGAGSVCNWDREEEQGGERARWSRRA
jgi:hypothetical protein